MTKIYVLGVLGMTYGSYFEMSVNSASSAIKAIDTNREGFIRKLFELSDRGVNYHVIVDGERVQNENELKVRRKIKSIYIIPAIVGSGPVIAGAIIAGLEITSTTAIAAITFAVNLLVSSAISVGISLLAASLNKQGSPPQQQRVAVGGATSTVEAQGKSYIFGNPQNVASQGASIPLGYGKLRISSNVVFSSIKNYPTNLKSSEEFTLNESSSIFTDFLAS